MGTEIINITDKIKFTATDSECIESLSHCIYDVDGRNWYNIPFWFEKVSEGTYRMVMPEDLPAIVKARIEKLK